MFKVSETLFLALVASVDVFFRVTSVVLVIESLFNLQHLSSDRLHSVIALMT